MMAKSPGPGDLSVSRKAALLQGVKWPKAVNVLSLPGSRTDLVIT